MDYYKGKDLDRQIQMLRGAAERFTELQIIKIGYHIAVALDFCHSRNILHQDMKPMNILLRESWNPLTQRDVPDLYVADFGIASNVQTIGTRITGQRGTPGYEAPEIRGQVYQAAFSQKSDIYAFGCILARLCSLSEPIVLDDIKPMDISMNYSIEILSLISTMLSSERYVRPTASQVKLQLATMAHRLLSTSLQCRTCQQTFSSKNQLSKHHKSSGHPWKIVLREPSPQPREQMPKDEPGLTIGGFADAPVDYHSDENGSDDQHKPATCMVCFKQFNAKKQLFGHLHSIQHYRKPKYILKRKAENELSMDVEKEDERLAKWIRKEM